jgi:two-component system cell cycle response regulator DivK
MASPAPRILIGEDHQDTLDGYSAYLTFCGLSVDGADTGAAILARVRETPPDLLLLDVGLPDIDGWEVTRLVRGESATRELPIIALTGFVQPVNRQRAFDLGCDRFVEKPCAPDEVFRQISDVLADRWMQRIDAATATFRQEQARHQELRKRAVALRDIFTVRRQSYGAARGDLVKTLGALKRLLGELP